MHVDTPDILTVSQLTRRVKSLLETEVSYVWVSGEISNWRVSPAGHAYFTIKDANSQISAVMFRGKLMRVKFGPEDGLQVVVNGLVTVYEARGTYQIVCDEMQPKGMGALQLAFEKLRRKLEAEGLFAEEIKKPLPLLPKRIGIVTSPTGAAVRDMLNVIGRRFANVHVLLYPARVQGDEAAEEIVEGIRVLDGMGVDVIIVGRGGGSLEDLWPFNEEIVVRAVHQARTPIISAVGHEIDFTLTDFAADVRAPTPSAAAELVVKEQEALLERVRLLGQRMARSMRHRVALARGRLTAAGGSFVFRRPEELLRQQRQRTDELRMRMESRMREQCRLAATRLDRLRRGLSLLSPRQQVRRAVERLHALRQRLSQAGQVMTERARLKLQPLAAQLDALSPLSILGRGYALAWRRSDGALIRGADQLAREDAIRVRFGHGSVQAVVTEIEDAADV